MLYLSVLALALPPAAVPAPGGPASDILPAAVLVAALLWVALLYWWARPARRSAPWPDGVCLLVIERSLLVTRLALSDQEQPGTTRETLAQNREEPPRCWSPPPRLHEAEQEILRQAGFTSAQMHRLLRYRTAYRAGHYHPDQYAPARLHFARWLYQHGKLSG